MPYIFFSSPIMSPTILSALLCHLRLKAPVEAFCLSFMCASWALWTSPKDPKAWVGSTPGLPLKLGFWVSGPIWVSPRFLAAPNL